MKGRKQHDQSTVSKAKASYYLYGWTVTMKHGAPFLCSSYMCAGRNTFPFRVVYRKHKYTHIQFHSHTDKKRDVSSFHLMAVWSLYSQHASAVWVPEGSHSAAESLGLILCIIKHSAACRSSSYTSSTLNKHNDDIRCNSR